MKSLQKCLGRAGRPRRIRALAAGLLTPLWAGPDRELAQTLLVCLLSYMHDFEEDGDWIRLLELTAASAEDAEGGSGLGSVMQRVGRHCRSSMAHAYWLAYRLAPAKDRRRAALALMQVLLRRCEGCCRLFEVEEVTMADLWARGFVEDGEEDT